MKDEIRKAAKFSRKSLTEQEISGKSYSVMENLCRFEDFKKTKTIMVYVSKKGEPDTHGIIRKLFQDGKTVVVPKTEKGRNTIVPCSIGSFQDLDEGEFGILEPRKAKIIEKEKVTLFIVPGLAFDPYGNRIGYGYGYWDMFLKGVDKNRIVGLCFENQLVESISPKPHDIAVSKIVTEKRIILCPG